MKLRTRKIREFVIAHQNEWMTAYQIAQKMGLFHADKTPNGYVVYPTLEKMVCEGFLKKKRAATFYYGQMKSMNFYRPTQQTEGKQP